MAHQANVIAVIPARGGSQRIPRKNLLPLSGKPLIAHSIEHAKSSRSVSRVLVSTDDGEIAEISRQYGAEVIMRPPELAVATATSESAIQHVLGLLQKQEGYQPDIIVFLQCTSPVREPDDIDNAVRLFIESGADSLFSVCRWNKFIWRRKGDKVESVNYDYKNRWREQDFPEQFMENGSIYVFKPNVLVELNNRLGGKIEVYEMDFLSSFQIDSPEDIEVCEWILKRQRAGVSHAG
ncbi:MAG: acylneuraminate cytidylyltransferase family protein [Thermodesulfovibrionales bacterium]|nr:acylneuraminate cytidylyltransferase family protein [Thermodesulfovibrionales bacterium]